MRAAVCRQFGQPLVIEEVELDDPGPGEVKVDVAACAVCHSDVTYTDGAWGGDLPAVYGHEAAGTVSAVGEGVSHLAEGDPVVVTLIRSCGRCWWCGRGEPTFCSARFALDERSPLRDAAGGTVAHGLRVAGFAEQALVHASQVVPVPPTLPPDAASLLACGVITGAGAALNTARVEPGSTVVVIGIGGVGVNAVQGARIAGARRIIAVDVVDDKLGLAAGFGATDAVNARDADVEGAVRGLTDGRGADYVFATVGAPSVMEQAVGLLRRGGTAVMVGIPGNGATMTLDAVTLPDSGLRVLGSKMGSARLPDDIVRMLEHWQRGELKLEELISSRHALTGINDAFEEVRRGGALRSVIVLR
ncbi:MAG: zinc-binding dehydrogenase [Acidimicrobiales bacterium]